jgi:hypothetical protein
VPTRTVTLEELYELYRHLQGQIAATTSLAAALAALHPDRRTIERVIEATAVSKGYPEPGSLATEQAYAAGMRHALAAFRAAIEGMTPST